MRRYQLSRNQEAMRRLQLGVAGKWQRYTIDPVQSAQGKPTDLILVQYDHHDYYAPEFRAGCLNGLSQLDFILSAYYYDDALWIHINGENYTDEQVAAITKIVKHVESTLVAEK